MALFSKQNKEVFTNPLNVDQPIKRRPSYSRSGVGYLLGIGCYIAA